MEPKLKIVFTKSKRFSLLNTKFSNGTSQLMIKGPFLWAGYITMAFCTRNSTSGVNIIVTEYKDFVSLSNSGSPVQWFS